MTLNGLLKLLLHSFPKLPNEQHDDQQRNAHDQSEAGISLAHLLDQFSDCADFSHHSYVDNEIHVVYFGHMIDELRLAHELKRYLQTTEELHSLLQHSNFARTDNVKEAVEGILAGFVVLWYRNTAYFIDASSDNSRAIDQSETETVITGPHESFNEVANTSLALIRKRVQSSHLKVVKLAVGEVTKSDVYILYIKNLVNTELVQLITTRIQQIEIDAVYDTNMLIQYIDDDPYSIFPQFLTSERPDAIASKLVAGRIVGMMDGSPSVFSAPTSFFEFFSSSDDYYQRWLLGTATRLLRFIAFIITISFTALYVSITTFQYEMIPENLLITLAESRSRVPFPPVLEALLMETTIELLREAGARLPTKIGQTIGIVGGIVIGQAAVSAGLTSNILIISVAASAISSFVIPSYIMSASFRLIRFGLILLAGIWGNMGIAMGITYIVIHLSGLKSLGTSYVTPIAPFQPKDWLDVFIRAPFSILRERPTQTKTPNKVRNRMKR
jgi:spore germination protein